MEHTLAMLGAEHGAAIATCGSCHLTKTAKAGAGRFGFLMGAPAGTDDDITCFESDIHAHVFDVPRRSAVRGTPPPPCA